MSFAELVQLYAPLGGLLALAFWSGVLSNRVTALERDAKASGAMHDMVIRIDQVVINLGQTMDRLATTVTALEGDIRAVNARPPLQAASRG
jgi:hypothetical protein